MLSQGGLIRILIAEDQEVVRLGLKLVLQKVPEIELIGEAEDGIQTVEMSEQLQPHVVLMDLRMPKLDGIEAARQIKARQKNTRIVILTSHATDDDIFAALGAGADGYCLKDSSGEQIVLAIKSVFLGAVWLDPAIGGRVLSACGSKAEETRRASAGIAKESKAAGLTDRELDVLHLVVEGLSNSEIAERLSLSHETVKTHMRHIMEKLMVSDRTQAAVKALRKGYV